MEESSIETTTNSPEDRHKDAVKMLRRTQLLFIPLSAISLATAYYTLSRHFALINLPPQSWILLLFTLLACWLGPIELMISASKLSSGEVTGVERVKKFASALLKIYLPLVGIQIVSAIAFGRATPSQIIGAAAITFAALVLSGLCIMLMLSDPAKLHKSPVMKIFIVSYWLLLLAVSVLQYPAILIFSACAFMVSPMVLTIRHPELTLKDVAIRLSSSLFFFVLPILSLTMAFGVEWQIVLPVLALQTLVFVTAPLMMPKSMRARIREKHA